MGKVKDLWQDQVENVVELYVTGKIRLAVLEEGLRKLYSGHEPGSVEEAIDAAVEAREEYLRDNGQFGVGS